MGRYLWLLAFVTLVVLVPSSAASYELRWEGNAPLVHSATTQVCTLSVWTSVGDCPLRSGTAWHLVWASQEAGADMTVLPGGDGATDYRPGDPSSCFGGQVDTLVQTFPAEHCPAPVGRFRFAFPASPRARIILTIEDTLAATTRIVAALSVGNEPPVPPPQITRGSVHDESGFSRVVVRGLGLERVGRAFWIGDSQRDTARATITSRASNRAELQFSRRLCNGPLSRLLLVDELGRGVAFPTSALTREQAENLSPRNPVVRFQPHTIDLPVGTTSASVEGLAAYCVGIRTALLGAGVDSLRRLLPVSHPTSEFTTNLLGEPILADDLADVYVAVLDSSTATDSAVVRLQNEPGIQYVDASPSAETEPVNDFETPAS